MWCGSCHNAKAQADDYLCAECREAMVPIPVRHKIAEILDLAAQVNKTDEYDLKVVVMTSQEERSPWVMLYVGELELSQFPRTNIVRQHKEFAIWESTGALYECQHGEVGDDPIPQAEWRNYLKLPLDKSFHPW